MPYLTTDQLNQRMKPDLQALEPDGKQTAIGDASDEVDTYLLAAGYDLPLVAPVTNGAFLQHIAAIARYRLAVNNYLIPEPAHQSQYYLDYKQALNWFTGLRTGETVLPLTDADTTNEDENLRGAVMVGGQARRGW
jgi:phage gp36-like protein